jgi:1-acyl-sn-glycerol-3-phosphate acyltransferase
LSEAKEILGRSLWAYRLLRWILKVATEVFFRRIEVGGAEHLPDDGAVIFFGNHPNSLLDPVLLTAHSKRVVHFAAKDVLFKNPVLRFFMGIAGAVPVRRRMDHDAESVDNSSMFETLYEVLAAGRATGIFPEGISHDRSQLAPMKTGAARLALGVKSRHPETSVYLVPTGLVYFDRHRFRSNVLIQYGLPIEIDDEWIARSVDDDQETVRELTELIDQRLRALTINADHWNRVWVLDAVRRLYQPPDASLGERVRIARRFNLAYPKVKADPEVRKVYRRVEAYLFRSQASGLDDATLRSDVGPSFIALSVIGHLVLLGVYLPLFLIGAIVHVPLGLLLKLASRYFAPRSDVVATTKFVLGLMLVILVYGLLIAVTWWKLGPWFALLIGLLLPSSGWATVKVLGRAYAVRHAMLTFVRLATLRKEIEELRRERGELVGEVTRLVEAFREVADQAEAELEGEQQ